MKYMIVESFKPGMADAVYARFEHKGRMLPPDLVYIDSWLSSDRSQCYQLMETEDSSLFKLWMSEWEDLVDFEIVPLVEPTTTRETRESGHG